MTPSEYRAIQIDITRKKGIRNPPCVKCSDETIGTCMDTGYECARFENYCEPLRDGKKNNWIGEG